MRGRLMPLATLITPNLPEAELLLDRPIADVAAMHEAIDGLRRLGARGVLLKGGHMPGSGDIVDLFAEGSRVTTIAHPRLQLEAHGTGCTLASAVAANLCLGRSLQSSCLVAADYVHAALRGGYRPGRSNIVVLDHLGAAAHV